MIDGVRRFHEQDANVRKEFCTRRHHDSMERFKYYSNAQVFAWRDTFSFRVAPAGTFEPKVLPPICRACPGETLAMRAISMTLALLVQCFDWELTSDGKIDMVEQDGFALKKSVPLKAMCKTRPVINKLFK
ncbi:unnamed protein product [Trifolium pratense]|uniref:Uncharacterized protein n=1 Tax=Trifolium pratense TaxID=57577 RepID=A0ACB0M8Z5_TRIPR|nr:unnamed protein product [Trifolium pratense]